MAIYAIAAMDQNRGIGFQSQLPWSYPSDLRLFKSLTMYSGLVMGRKTFESLGKPLPGRGHYVVTRSKQQLPVSTFDSIASAISASNNDFKHTFIIGGAEVFAQSLHLVDVLYLTRINRVFAADVYFPELPSNLKLCYTLSLQAELSVEVYKNG